MRTATKKLSLRKARTAAAWSGALFGCLLGAVAFYGALLGSFNSTLFLFAAFLLLGAGGEILRLPDIQIEALLGREEALRSGRPIAVSETAVYHKTSAGEALKLLRRGNYNLLRVVGERNRVLGELDEGMLTEGLVKLGPNASLSSLLFLFDQRKNM